MTIFRLNHAVLYVENLERSVAFYCDVFGFTPLEAVAGLSGAAFLRAPGSTNDHDLGLFEVGGPPLASRGGRPAVGLYHLAWEVETLADLRAMEATLAAAGALTGASDHSATKSLYGKDPDGLEFEIVWLVPADRVDDEVLANRQFIRPLDLDREIARYGADTRSGIGISRTV